MDLNPDPSNDPGLDSNSSDFNIKEVYDAIRQADPTFDEAVRDQQRIGVENSNAMFQPTTSAQDASQSPYTVIIEQPAQKALRFRYECEGRQAGSIPGESSEPRNKTDPKTDIKTYPKIGIRGYKGHAVVVVSCVTAEEPYRPHPHNLVGRDGCKNGICTLPFNSDMTVTFTNLGIQCVKKKDIPAALKRRKDFKVDPFKTGYDIRPGDIDLNAVRLCFQVFIAVDNAKEARFALKPVVSNIIFDKKAKNDLVICKMSAASASAAGGEEVFIFCEKITKDDISVVVVEMQGEETVIWESEAQIIYVHKQMGIIFKVPPYKNTDITETVDVYVMLRKPLDTAVTSEKRTFQYRPVDSEGPPLRDAKRRRHDNNKELMSQLAMNELNRQPNMQQYYDFFKIPEDAVKLEPPEPLATTSFMPDPNASYRVNQPTPSPPNFQNTPSPPQYAGRPTPSPQFGGQTPSPAQYQGHAPSPMQFTGQASPSQYAGRNTSPSQYNGQPAAPSPYFVQNPFAVQSTQFTQMQAPTVKQQYENQTNSLFTPKIELPVYNSAINNMVNSFYGAETNPFATPQVFSNQNQVHMNIPLDESNQQTNAYSSWPSNTDGASGNSLSAVEPMRLSGLNPVDLMNALDDTEQLSDTLSKLSAS